MRTTQFEVQRDDLTHSRVIAGDVPVLDDGEVRVKVDRFALTANNITYGVVGEKLGYWKFFPVESGWGIIPVWGFADVVETKHPDVTEGERLYGYLPMATHLVMRPGRLSESRLEDAATHRAELSPVYNSYARLSGDASYDPSMDDDRMLLLPLYATSFCLSDFLQDNDFFAATQIIIPSASSKTAIGLVYSLRDDAVSQRIVGLTSTGNRAKVEALDLYDTVLSYDERAEIDNTKASVIVDMSGNGTMLSDLHAHLGDNMKFTSNVGITHYEENAMGPDFIRERSAMFFAPGHIQKRTKDWGPGEFEKKSYLFWHAAALKSREWLAIDRHRGMESVSKVFSALREGRIPPDKGVVITL